MILHEFDPSQIAMINPADTHPDITDLPKVAVSCFSKTTFDRMLTELGGGTEVAQCGTRAPAIIMHRRRMRY